MAERVVLDGELSLTNQFDGDVSLDAQMDGDASGVIKIRPVLEPITVSKNGTFYPSEGMDGFSSVTVDADIKYDYEWRKPEDWPDLESIELPHRDDISTIYFLFDRSCGIDAVDFYVTGNKQYVAKGSIENGKFVEKERLHDTGHIYRYYDTLTERYTVYKIEGNSTIGFGSSLKIGSAYCWYNYGCVWIYGEGSKLSGIGDNHLTPFLRRMVLTRVKTNNHTFPNNFSIGGGFDVPISYHIGSGDVLDDWDGLAIRRTGNGPITPPIKQKSDYVVRNITFNNQYDKGNISARNVVLVNPHGTLFNSQYRDDHLIEKFVIVGGDMTCRPNALYTCFSNAVNLRICDLRDLDMSGYTSGTTDFSGCYMLKELYLNSTHKRPLNIQKSPLLKTDCAIKILNDLPEIDTTMRITFHRQVYLRIPEEIIEAAESKGWDIRQSDYD